MSTGFGHFKVSKVLPIHSFSTYSPQSSWHISYRGIRFLFPGGKSSWPVLSAIMSQLICNLKRSRLRNAVTLSTVPCDDEDRDATQVVGSPDAAASLRKFH